MFFATINSQWFLFTILILTQLSSTSGVFGDQLIKLKAIVQGDEMTPTSLTINSRARMGYASGVVVGILLPLALLLFGVLSPLRTLALIFLLVGLWTVLFGFEYQREKMYWIGWGAGLAVLSTIAFVPLQYTIGIVLVVIVILILASSFGRRSAMRSSSGPAAPS